MADSVDRVFGHALNTVNKIRTGSQKPPVTERLKLYGLYKQSMEGDVSYVQERPVGDSDQARKDQEKWDSWNGNSGLSRTEAKKRYIETLIQTMHTYASSTPEARELVSELEFVWDQVKNNSNPSTSSQGSPLQVHDHAQSYPGLPTSSVGALDSERPRAPDTTRGTMRVMSPVSQPAEDEAEEEDREEFVDAPVSQFGEQDMDTPGDERTDPVSGTSERPVGTVSRKAATLDSRWRKRVESALVKMTAEVAALREQLESRRYVSQQRRNSLFGWLRRLGWFGIKLVVVDVFALWILILYLRRKKDRRLEGAIRVMLGDAQAVAQNLAASMQQKVGTKLPIRK